MARCAIRPTCSPSMLGTTPWSLRSRPEVKARPEPVSTTTQVSFSSPIATRASWSSSTSSIDSGVQPVGPVEPDHRHVRPGPLHQDQR